MINSRRNEKGVALPLALFALVMLMGLLLAFLTMAGMEPVIAQNHVTTSRALYIADAGIEHAWDAVQRPPAGSPALPQVGQTATLFNGQALGAGTYTVTVLANADGTYTLTSTGTYPNVPPNVSRQITALVGVGIPVPRGSAEALVDPNGVPGVGSEKGERIQFDVEPDGGIDGRDWNAPADLTACNDIAGCGTLLDPTQNPALHGGYTNTGQHPNSVEISGNGFIAGQGCLSGPCSTDPATASVNYDTVDPLAKFTRWDKFIDQAILKANNVENVGAKLSGTRNWGTAAAPQITHVQQNGSKFDWNATVNGAGVLIIDIATTDHIKVGGNGVLNWQGLVIVRTPGSVEWEQASKGTARIFGQFVVRATNYVEIEFENNKSFYKYSSNAMKLVQPLGSSSFRSWRER